VDGWLEKNRDTLQVDLLNLMLGSKIDLFRALFEGVQSDANITKATTVGGTFKARPTLLRNHRVHLCNSCGRGSRCSAGRHIVTCSIVTLLLQPQLL
jgi:hypothetical protein